MIPENLLAHLNLSLEPCLYDFLNNKPVPKITESGMEHQNPGNGTISKFKTNLTALNHCPHHITRNNDTNNNTQNTKNTVQMTKSKTYFIIKH